jgi:dTDP-glucose pyrophosphorylase
VAEAIVMAAGEGRRLRPLTERWAKPVLPIDGRPVIATLLAALREAGFETVTVVTGFRAEQVERLLGDGGGFGLHVRYARQPEPDGSADAVSRALAAGARTPCVVATADTVFAAGDLARLAAAGAAVAVRRSPAVGAPVVVDGGRVTRIGAGEGPLFHASLWGLTGELAAYLSGLAGPPYELADGYRRAIGDGYEVAAVEVGPTRDLTEPLDLVQENFPYLGAFE